MKYCVIWRWPKASLSVSSISCGEMPKRDAWSRLMRDLELRRVRQQIAGDVGDLRQRPHLVEHLAGPFAQLVEIGILQRVLEARAGDAAADGDVLRRLQEQR